ncbi:MAG: D-glycero-beta-D-manno-heptose-7-phosphate kinase [bacterium]|nr:D-glycero-beta-D-manno-heptose-7-phosphate kinase [bacterium]
MDISGFKRTRVLVLGDVMLDRYWWGSVTRISPEAPVPIVRLERETLRPGGAANVAANASALGSTVELIGVVGRDSDASALERISEGCGLTSQHLIASDTRGTIVKTRVVAHGQHVIRLDSEDARESSEEEAHGLVSKLKSRIEESDVLILSDYGKGVLTQAIVTEAVSLSKEAGIPVLADPKGKHFEKYMGATVLTPNRREAAEACKLEENQADLVQTAGNRLLQDLSLENVLITESENGMTLFRQNGEDVHFDTTAREVFDVTGAGDTVIATLAVALAAGMSMVDAALLANTAAGLSVQHIGTAAVSYQELREELDLFDAGKSR